MTNTVAKTYNPHRSGFSGLPGAAITAIERNARRDAQRFLAASGLTKISMWLHHHTNTKGEEVTGEVIRLHCRLQQYRNEKHCFS